MKAVTSTPLVFLFGTILLQPTIADPLANLTVYPGTWYADRLGVPSIIELKRIGGAVIDDHQCKWSSEEFSRSANSVQGLQTYTLIHEDGIRVECDGKLPIYLSISFCPPAGACHDGEWKNRHITAFIPKEYGEVRANYYPSIQARDDAIQRARQGLENW